MANKEARGTKRTCQNDECETKFYDLNRDPIVCPDCESVYQLAPVAEEIPAPVVVAPAPAKPADTEASTDGDEVADDDDALVSLEEADAELGNDDDDDAEDDTFLATDDEDDQGVGDIIVGVEKDDEDT